MHSPWLLCSFALNFASTNAFSSAAPTTALDYEAIRNTLATYPLMIGSKQFQLLDQVFTSDVVANYSAPLGVLIGLPQVESMLQQS
jgi:hypothetical protein